MIYAGLDLETTGLLEDGHRIVEIAVLLYDPAMSIETPLDQFVTRVNPQRPIEAGATAVHGITFEMVASEKTFEEHAERFLSFLKRADVIVAHNGRGFDLPFVKKEFTRIGTALPLVRLVDTMLEGRWATPFGKVPNLEELCFATEVEYDRSAAHAAEYDARKMMNAYFKGMRKGFFTEKGEVFE